MDVPITIGCYITQQGAAKLLTPSDNGMHLVVTILITTIVRFPGTTVCTCKL